MCSALSFPLFDIVAKASLSTMECHVMVFVCSKGGFQTYYTSFFNSYLTLVQLENYFADTFVTKCYFCIFL